MNEMSEIASSVLDGVSRPATLTDQVYARMRRGLLIGLWRPGERISTRGVAREMGVGLTPVREAMMRLANEGALHVTATRAFEAPDLSVDAYEELLRIRLALEPMAAAQAAIIMSDERLDQIEALNERLGAELKTDAFDQTMELDSEFHLAIYREARQPLLLSFIDSLLLRAGPTRTRLSREYRKSLAGYSHHKRIIAALRDHDGEAARAEVASDLSDGAAAVIPLLRKAAETGASGQAPTP